jgi:hypothetical protein
MISVGHGAIAANIDPRVSGARDHITLQGGLARDVEWEPLIVCARVGSATPSPKANAEIRRRIQLI